MAIVSLLSDSFFVLHLSALSVYISSKIKSMADYIEDDNDKKRNDKQL